MVKNGLTAQEKKIVNFNKIRFLKFVELLQYTIIFYFIAILISKFLNKYLFTTKEKEIKKYSFMKLSSSIILQLFILIITFFYIRKIVKAIPSIAGLISKDFIPLTTLEYSMHIAFVFFFLEIIKNLKLKISLIEEKLPSILNKLFK
jgi:hypothetical protein